ncbi:MAG: hypothetical protein ACOC78_00175 [Actinomycetota bacterium]
MGTKRILVAILGLDQHELGAVAVSTCELRPDCVFYDHFAVA